MLEKVLELDSKQHRDPGIKKLSSHSGPLLLLSGATRRQRRKELIPKKREPDIAQLVLFNLGPALVPRDLAHW